LLLKKWFKIWCDSILPGALYIDFENKDGRDAGKDIVEVERLKSANVDGIQVYYRDDGGGSHQNCCVDIAGLFIEQGPIVQIKFSRKKRVSLYDRDKNSNGMAKLVIMVISFSAFKLEIHKAIQDYKEGFFGLLAVGKHSGKGTGAMQIDLNQF
jgi:carboxyl-terminal processing protease